MVFVKRNVAPGFLFHCQDEWVSVKSRAKWFNDTVQSATDVVLKSGIVVGTGKESVFEWVRWFVCSESSEG